MLRVAQGAVSSKAPTRRIHSGVIHQGRRQAKAERKRLDVEAAKRWASSRGHISLFAMVGLLICSTGDRLAYLPSGGPATVVIVSMSLMAGLIIVPSRSKVGPSPFLRPSHTMPAVWFLFLIWSVFIFSAHGFSVGGLQNFLVYLILILGIWVQAHRCKVGTEAVLAKWIIRSGWVLAVIVMPQTFLAGFDSSGGIVSRRSFGIVAIFAFAAVCAYWRQLPLRHRWLAGILLVEIALSGARLALGAAFIIAAVSTLARNPNPWRLVWRGALLSTAFVILVNTWAPLRERFTEGDQGLRVGGLVINTEGRWPVWIYLWRKFSENPWGHGFGEAQRITVQVTQNRIPQPHNDYLRLLVDVGLAGFVLFVGGMAVLALWLFHLLRRDLEHRALHAMALASLAGLMMGMLTDNALIYFFVIIPAAMIIGTSLGHSQLSEPDPTSLVPTTSLAAAISSGPPR